MSDRSERAIQVGHASKSDASGGGRAAGTFASRKRTIFAASSTSTNGMVRAGAADLDHCGLAYFYIVSDVRGLGVDRS
jgi:hypothetical protein